MTEQETGRDERLHDAAERVALRTGLLRRCPAHGTVYDPGQHDYQGACMTAAFLVNNADPLVAAFGGDRQTLYGRLRTICDAYPRRCPECPTG